LAEVSHDAGESEAGISVVVPRARYEKHSRAFYVDAPAGEAQRIEHELGE
jgi:DNA-binding IclR family transcriptional regulator